MVYVYYPDTPEGWTELKRRVADVHADAVYEMVKQQRCSTSQKQALLKQVGLRYKKRTESSVG